MSKTKALTGVKITDTDTGGVEAVFATFDTVDADGDLTVKGAFTDGAPVVISAYGHQSWKGALPVGKGTIHETDTEAVMVGQFFMDTTHGSDTFRTVKNLSEGESLQEWSYSLQDVVAEKQVIDGRSVNVLKSIRVKEVSPVLVGAGVNTRTLITKNHKQLNSDLAARLRGLGRERFGAEDTWVWLRDYDVDDLTAIFEIESDDEIRLVSVPFTRDGDTPSLGDDETDVEPATSYVPKTRKFSEHIESVLTDVDALITRATQVKTLRDAQGKQLGTSSADLLDRLDGELRRLSEVFATTQDEGTNPADEFARFVAITQGV